jgi:hypothetical protein
MSPNNMMLRKVLDSAIRRGLLIDFDFAVRIQAISGAIRTGNVRPQGTVSHVAIMTSMGY